MPCPRFINLANFQSCLKQMGSVMGLSGGGQAAVRCLVARGPCPSSWFTLAVIDGAARHLKDVVRMSRHGSAPPKAGAVSGGRRADGRPMSPRSMGVFSLGALQTPDLSWSQRERGRGWGVQRAWADLVLPLPNLLFPSSQSDCPHPLHPQPLYIPSNSPSP